MRMLHEPSLAHLATYRTRTSTGVFASRVGKKTFWIVWVAIEKVSGQTFNLLISNTWRRTETMMVMIIEMTIIMMTVNVLLSTTNTTQVYSKINNSILHWALAKLVSVHNWVERVQTIQYKRDTYLHTAIFKNAHGNLAGFPLNRRIGGIAPRSYSYPTIGISTIVMRFCYTTIGKYFDVEKSVGVWKLGCPLLTLSATFRCTFYAPVTLAPFVGPTIYIKVN